MIRSTFALFAALLAGPVAADAHMMFELRGNGGNCRGCEWISAEGEITPQTPEAFSQLGTYPGLTVVLSSRGGDLAAGMELGRLFRQAGLTTRVGRTIPDIGLWHRVDQEASECSSACAYAFLGGQTRWLETNTRLGFHQFYDRTLLNAPPQVMSELEQIYQDARDQYVTGQIVSYLIDMQIDTRLYSIASAVGPNDPIRYLTAEEAVLIGIDNVTDALGPWSITPFGEGLLAEATTSSSDRKLRLYCSNDGNHYLTYFIPSDAPDQDAQTIDNTLSRYSDRRVDLRIGKLVIESRVTVVAPSTATGHVVVALALEEIEAQRIAQAPSIMFFNDNLSVPNVGLGVYVDLFKIDHITGNPHMPLRGFRLCI